jgi:predicted nucleic acid-binding protein
MPASGRLLLDTNIVIALLEGDEAVLSNLDEAAEIFIPAIVLGELFFGAAKSGRPTENTAKVERFAADRSFLSCDLHAREYGRLRLPISDGPCARRQAPLSWNITNGKCFGLPGHHEPARRQ